MSSNEVQMSTPTNQKSWLTNPWVLGTVAVVILSLIVWLLWLWLKDEKPTISSNTVLSGKMVV